MEREKKK
jgi:hypothetical protein